MQWDDDPPTRDYGSEPQFHKPVMPHRGRMAVWMLAALVVEIIVAVVLSR